MCSSVGPGPLRAAIPSFMRPFLAHPVPPAEDQAGTEEQTNGGMEGPGS
jgi:hypothetical protein